MYYLSYGILYPEKNINLLHLVEMQLLVARRTLQHPFASRRDASIHLLDASLRDAKMEFGGYCFATNRCISTRCGLQSIFSNCRLIIAIPLNIKGIATIFIADSLDIISGIFQSVVSTNLLHLGEMHRSVAKRTPPKPLFASRRDATKIGSISNGIAITVSPNFLCTYNYIKYN